MLGSTVFGGLVCGKFISVLRFPVAKFALLFAVTFFVWESKSLALKDENYLIQIFVGSLAATYLFQNHNTKIILCLTLLCNAGSLFLFTQTSNFYLLFASRFMTGFFQVFPCIYYPVWADTFGTNEKQKQLFLNFLLLCGPIGVLLGYMMAAWFITHFNWRYAFYA